MSRGDSVRPLSDVNQEDVGEKTEAAEEEAPTELSAEAEQEAEQRGEEDFKLKKHCSSRPVKPNPMYHGPQWAVYVLSTWLHGLARFTISVGFLGS
ncbi:Os11g0576700 [Oryza sativa Japonica Group]|uniref:Os11g0576700 protein n=3 Tax=Oryza TaxID=4527 RepID=Q0IS14_ORYSJ|nr:hypothetical protein LOC_Os11g36810 [Oryza sativa Japonica Group]BAF28501.1 Os11g0576700 [Oryza sativa Japonica Group]|eukprot:NP_001068138.1 Os11g0576700 [Oryza sativa Japonica Group]